ncbi:MAG: hypothetical protein GF313_10080 [Caldithrix sp.]|nr:hypothetical protein [Caldithrix sp.]
MIKKTAFFIIVFLVMQAVHGQQLYKAGYRLQDEDGALFEGRLHGNGIVDLLVHQNRVYAATGYGLNVTADFGESWQTFYPRDYKGKGGISAMGFMDDSTLWVASAFDTTVSDDNLPAGGGLSYTRDFGQTWQHIRQPVDSVNEVNYAPTTTNVQNLTYDIAFVDSTVWIASFGGGLRRSDDMGQTWQVVTTDGLPFSSLNYLNHRVFSLLNVHDTLWVGTAGGISMSPDNGQSWTQFAHSADDSSTLSGNFVVALAYQEQTGMLWAATIQADSETELRAVSRTVDAGETWQRLLVDESLFAHNFAFDGRKVFVASDLGVYYSFDAGNTWKTSITDLQDFQSGDEMFQDEFYSAAVQPDNGLPRLWLGGSDGLATTINYDFEDWQIIRSYVSTEVRKDPEIYAYPTPFSPSRQQFIRFQFAANKALDEPIEIYDFAMDKVTTVPVSGLKPKWDGTNSAGQIVASGVYFFRAQLNGQVTWGKIVIIN